jgi:ubiquitin-protein ligase
MSNACPRTLCHALLLPLPPFLLHPAVRSSSTSTLQAAPFHFLLKFTPDYPTSRPELRLFQPIPHPNVKPVTGGIQVLNAAAAAAGPGNSSGGSRSIPRQARWRLALWDCIPGKDSWSSGYSVQSVLLQLQGESNIHSTWSTKHSVIA